MVEVSHGLKMISSLSTNDYALSISAMSITSNELSQQAITVSGAQISIHLASPHSLLEATVQIWTSPLRQ